MTPRLSHAAPRFASVLLFACVAAAVNAQPHGPLPGAVLPLYRQLRSVGLDSHQVFKIREADIDREDVHISLNDGTIGFLETVNGHVTGAYFEGDGEVLIRPPDRRERASLGLFTGQGVLEERFSSAYLRFNDETARELEPFLRPPEDANGFIARNDSVTRRLGAIDAMRLCISFTSGPAVSAPGEPTPLADRLLHVRIGGLHYGVFDVYFDTRSPEQIVVGKTSLAGEQTYYDLWMSFPMRSLRAGPQGGSRFHGPTGPVWTRDALRVRKHTINAKVNPPRDLSAEATLDVEVRQGGPRIVLFELSRYLHMNRVELDGSSLEFIQNEAVEGSELSRRGNDLVAVVFPDTLKLGTRFALRFSYAGSVLSDAGGGLVSVGARGTWYPNRGIAMSDYDLTFRFPQSWTLVATGKQVSVEREGEDFVGHWVSEKPIPIAGFNLGQYVRSSAKLGNIEVDNYATHGVEKNMLPMSKKEGIPASGFPPTTPVAPNDAPAILNPAGAGQEVAQLAAQIIATYSKILGPYPFTTLALTQRPGMESQGWPGLIFLSSYVYLTRPQRDAMKLLPADKILYSDVMLPHEVAHQWFGDKVSWASYHEQWLLEALANYCALMLLEESRPADVQVMLDTYRDFLNERSKTGPKNVEAGPVTLGVRLGSSRFPSGYEVITYGRGTWLVHMLRCMLRDASRTTANPAGDDTTFRSVLRNLLERHENQELTNADFERSFEEVLPKSLWFENRPSLDWFFDGWVNGTAFPKLELSDVKLTRRTGMSSVSGIVRQLSAPADLVTSVPVYGVVEERRVYLGRVFAEGEETRFTLKVPASINRLVLDPYSTVLTSQ